MRLVMLAAFLLAGCAPVTYQMSGIAGSACADACSPNFCRHGIDDDEVTSPEVDCQSRDATRCVCSPEE